MTSKSISLLYKCDEMLNELGWKSLVERRKHMRLTMMYKITNSLVAINGINYLETCLRKIGKYKDLAFILPGTRPDYFNYSFLYAPYRTRTFSHAIL